ncbi:YegP family protein [Arthrobacter cavernae]|uniref:DUF1508 domain-containing protein n=1 Tax=Arthrobacter cavernae TaxID=2817681 RepID=A0A939HHB9_9MICC|nr:DUF1508 domain-containing protein [Arthrobacter cavernae]MBO1267323.1 DUF1508 domain-containing protein [Arthrobacter cavernae]
MAGMFELFVDAEAYFRFRLTAPDGTVMAVSKAFDDKPAAVAGITAVREYAGMGLITDLCPAATRSKPPAAAAHPHSVPPTRQDQRIPAGDLHARARAVRRAAHGAGWAGAA